MNAPIERYSIGSILNTSLSGVNYAVNEIQGEGIIILNKIIPQDLFVSFDSDNELYPVKNFEIIQRKFINKVVFHLKQLTFNGLSTTIVSDLPIQFLVFKNTDNLTELLTSIRRDESETLILNHNGNPGGFSLERISFDEISVAIKIPDITNSFIISGGISNVNQFEIHYITPRIDEISTFSTSLVTFKNSLNSITVDNVFSHAFTCYFLVK